MTEDRRYPLGKLPARKNAVTFRLANYLDTTKLPSPPKQFGHEALVPDFRMLGNDRCGDCVIAGAAHETMIWAREGDASSAVDFTDTAVLGDYSAVTGYVPGDESTDNGTDMQEAASYRRKVGILDAAGARHTVVAYLAIDHRSPAKLAQAAWLFGAVGWGFQFPTSAWAQFDARKPWTYHPGSKIDGGHYVPIVARRKHLVCVTWGRTQEMSQCFVKRWGDEAVAYVSAETISRASSLSPEGFDVQQLVKDLAALR